MFISPFNQLDAKKLIEPSRIFEKTPNPQGLYQLSMVFGLFLVIALIIFLVIKKQKQTFKNYFNRLINLLLFTGIMGEIIVFCRWQGIPYLGSRLMFYLLFLIFIIWGIYIIWFRFMVFSKEVEDLKRREKFEKYLPGKR